MSQSSIHSQKQIDEIGIDSISQERNQPNQSFQMTQKSVVSEKVAKFSLKKKKYFSKLNAKKNSKIFPELHEQIVKTEI